MSAANYIKEVASHLTKEERNADHFLEE